VADFVGGFILTQQSLVSFSLLIMLGFCGCKREQLKVEPPAIPTVTVSHPVSRDVTEYEYFTGRTAAPFSVEVRPRVTGYLKEMPFKEGDVVKQGALLFQIDEEPYTSQLKKAQSDLALNQAKLKLAQADNERALAISKVNSGAISKQDLDKYQAAVDEADAAVKASEANVDVYQINLNFTKVTAAIDGQVGRYSYTIGNLVNADTTTLTTIVSQDPIYAYFDVDEQTLLKVGRRLMENHVDLKKPSTFPVKMGLGDENDYPHEGYIDFVNNVVSSSTGTLTLRGSFANPQNDQSGRRLLRPGMFVKVQLPVRKPSKKMLVSERALGTDQGQKFVMVVDEKNTVNSVVVTVGPLQDDGLRVIESGLTEQDLVIVSGLQFVKPKSQVKTEKTPMIKGELLNDGIPVEDPVVPDPAPTQEQKK